MSRGLRFASRDALSKSMRNKVDCSPPSRKRIRRKRRDEEHEEQVVLFNRIDTLALNDARYALPARSTHAIPNGGGRSIAEAGRLKAEGVRKGVSDIFVRMPAPGYHGLYIELKKRKGGRVSPEQNTWIEDAKLLGYRACVCKGADEAWAVWRDYVWRALARLKAES